MQNLDNVNIFFIVATTEGLSNESYALCLQCLAEFASCRLSLFESFDLSKQFTPNFANNLINLLRKRAEFFCGDRVLARNFIKIMFKFEMNFQVRSFGIKEDQDLNVLLAYLGDLSELTLILIKSGSQYLRDNAIHLLVAWNRINIELKNQDVSCSEQVKLKIKDIVVQFLEQNISDMNDHSEEEEEEHFFESEVNTQTQRFDMIARICNVHIEDTFDRLSQGLTFLIENYGSPDKTEVIEQRMAWTLRVITALINLGYAPKREEDTINFSETPEYCVCIKTIEIVKTTIDMYMTQSKMVDDGLDMAILSFIATFRSSILADPRVVAKVMRNDEDNAIHKSEGYIRVAKSLETKDILGIVEIFLKKMIITFFST